MPFTIPNAVDAEDPSQAQVDARDFSDILAAGFSWTGVVTGCAVTAQGTPNMTVAVAAGTVCVNGAVATVTAGNVTITTADATNPRFDLICVDSAGVKSAVAGTPAANPVFPSAGGKLVLAAVRVPAAIASISAAKIVDKRVMNTINTLYFGSAADTNLYRTASTVLKTDGSFRVGNYLDVDFGGTGAMLRFGSAVDTNLYRSQASVLKTDGGFIAGTFMVVGFGNSDTSLWFGSAYDTHLYRHSANYIRTPGTLIADNGIISGIGVGSGSSAFYAYVSGDSGWRFNVTNDGKLGWHSGANFSTPDTNLYRSSAGNLNTDGSFWVGGSLDVASTLYLGTALDTYIYRSAASAMLTNSQLQFARPNTSDWALMANKSGDTIVRWYIRADGYMGWSDGTNYDVDLFRHGNKWLASNWPILSQSGGGAVLIAAGANSSILFGASSDTNLYRGGLGRLVLEPTSSVADFRVQSVSYPRFSWNSTGNAADQKKWQMYALTDGQMKLTALNDAENSEVIALQWQRNGDTTVGARLYVNSTASFSIQASGGIILDVANAQNALYFGSASDTFLYRSAANTLRTNSHLIVDGEIRPNASNGFGVGPPPPGSNFNNAVNNGWYSIAPGYTNAPVNDYGALEVANITYTGACRQVFFRHAAKEIWQRYLSGGIWSSWWRIDGHEQQAGSTAIPSGISDVTYPAVFTSGVPVVSITVEDPTSTNHVVTIGARTASKFTVYNGTGVGLTINWIATVP